MHFKVVTYGMYAEDISGIWEWLGTEVTGNTGIYMAQGHDQIYI